jgi:hypothetical protein
MVEYLWGTDGDNSASGPLDLAASGQDFLKSLEETCQCSLDKDLDRHLHSVHFLAEGDRPKKRILHLHDDLAIQDEWDSTVTWIQKNKSSKRPQLQVAIVLKKRARVT